MNLVTCGLSYFGLWPLLSFPVYYSPAFVLSWFQIETCRVLFFSRECAAFFNISLRKITGVFINLRYIKQRAHVCYYYFVFEFFFWFYFEHFLIYDSGFIVAKIYETLRGTGFCFIYSGEAFFFFVYFICFCCQFRRTHSNFTKMITSLFRSYLMSLCTVMRKPKKNEIFRLLFVQLKFFLYSIILLFCKFD